MKGKNSNNARKGVFSRKNGTEFDRRGGESLTGIFAWLFSSS